MKAISWRRKPMHKQGRLGLDAQKELIDYHIKMQNYEWVADYCDTYTGTHLNGCTELFKAIEHCKRIGATLVIAKTDRFRNVAEALTIFEALNGNIYFCDAPTQDKMILTIMFAIYEREALNISIRTKAALDAKRKRDGSWTKEYGKNTGTTHAEAWDKALDASIATRKRKAEANENNIRFAKWLAVWESKHGTVDRHTDLDILLQEVNALGYKTSSGMEFNKNSLRSMIYRTHDRKTDQIKEQYNYKADNITNRNATSIKEPTSDKPATYHNPIEHPLTLNQEKLQILEHETKVSQKMLSEIFVDEDEPQMPMLIEKSWKSLMDVIFTKESWKREDLEQRCGALNMMLSAVLEQINDYSYEKIDDAAVEDDGEIIYVNLEYKDILI